MPVSALPLRLQANRFAEGDGTDLDNRAQGRWDRAWDAFGPNANADDWGRITLVPIPWTKYRIATPFKVPGKWRRFPKLWFGYNVTRWMSVKDELVFMLPGFANKLILFGLMYFKGEGIVKVTSAKRKLAALDYTPKGFGNPYYIDAKDLGTKYGPSPLQQFSPEMSFQVTWPVFVAFQLGGTIKKDRVFSFDPEFYVRLFARWDSGDDLFYFPSYFIGGTSN